MNYQTTFEGILETLDNQDIPYQKSFADILLNDNISTQYLKLINFNNIVVLFKKIIYFFS